MPPRARARTGTGALHLLAHPSSYARRLGRSHHGPAPAPSCPPSAGAISHGLQTTCFWMEPAGRGGQIYIRELAMEVESKLSGRMDMQRKDRTRMESKVSSLVKENQEIHTMLKAAITEKEAAEDSLRALKGEKEQGRSAILQIADRGLHKVGFGFIMEVISGEPKSEEEPTTSGTATATLDLSCAMYLHGFLNHPSAH